MTVTVGTDSAPAARCSEKSEKSARSLAVLSISWRRQPTACAASPAAG